MSHHRQYASENPRPPTPYPFPSDTTWGTFPKSRGASHLPHQKSIIERTIYKRPCRLYRHVVPLSGRLSNHKISRDYSRSVQWKAVSKNALTSDIYVAGRDPNKLSVEDPAVQRWINAQNTKIADRTPVHRHTSGENILKQTQKKVHFQIPNRRDDNIVEQFDRLRIENHKRPPERCHACRQRLHHQTPYNCRTQVSGFQL
jgi:hypothetical protein